MCKQKHHTKLHFDSKNNDSIAFFSDIASPVASSKNQLDSNPLYGVHLAAVKRPVLLATATIIVCDQFGKSFTARALIDSGAQRSFITERLASQLTVARRPVSISILGVGGQATACSRGEITITLKSRTNETFKCNCSALILPELTCMLPDHQICVNDWPHLRDLQLADPDYHTPRKIDVILGADVYGLILQDEFVRGSVKTPIAQNTVFGWILTGVVDPENPSTDSSTVTAYHTVTQTSLDQALSLDSGKLKNYLLAKSSRRKRISVISTLPQSTLMTINVAS